MDLMLAENGQWGQTSPIGKLIQVTLHLHQDGILGFNQKGYHLVLMMREQELVEGESSF